MLIYVCKPTTGRVSQGLLINTDQIVTVVPQRFWWASRVDGSKITFTTGEILIVTDSVEKIKKESEARKCAS